MSPTQQFLATHPVFTFAEFREALGEGKSEKTLRNQIAYYLRRERICSIGQGGIYCVVPAGASSDRYVPDRFLVASRLRPDAVIVCHSAFEFMGAANQVFATTYYASAAPKRVLRFRGTTYHCLRRERSQEDVQAGIGTETVAGLPVRVTSRERTVLDCLDRPVYGGGWDEVCRCIASLPVLDLPWILEYLRGRRKPTLAAKTGYVLETYRDKFYPSQDWLEELRALSPRSAVKLDRHRRGVYVGRWNLVVPEDLVRWLEATR